MSSVPPFHDASVSEVIRPSEPATHVSTTSLPAIASGSSPKSSHTTVDRRGELMPAVDAAVDHRDVRRPGLAQRRGDAGAQVTGADDEHVLPSECVEAIGGELDRGLADRRGAAPDGRLGAGPLARAQCVAEQQIEGRAHATGFPGDLPRRAHLAENLALTEH